MKSKKLVVMLSLFVILMTVFSNVSAQDTGLPAFKVSSVVTDEKLVLSTKDFPADTAYTVSMASPEDPDNFTAVAKFNSKTGGSLNVTVKIPEKFHGFNEVLLMLRDGNGGKILGNFINDPNAAPAAEEPAAEEPAAEEPAAEEPEPIALTNQEPAAEEPAAEEPTAEEPEPIALTNQEPASGEPAAEEPAAEEPEPIALTNQEPAAEEPVIQQPAAAAEEPVIEQPAAAAAEQPAEIPVLVCNFAVIPSVTINSVVKDESVTFTTSNFPSNSTFSVSMGQYVQSWVPDPMPRPQPRPFMPRPMPDFKPAPEKPEPHHHHHPAPVPHGHTVTTFSGTETGTFDTGNGEPQTLTFTIPESVRGNNPIAIWISDLGPCGFYSYNYFYNNTVN